jgi:hypothetical protein
MDVYHGAGLEPFEPLAVLLRLLMLLARRCRMARGMR